jgi:hypothetical protein
LFKWIKIKRHVDFIDIIKMTPIQQAEKYYDDYPLLGLRLLLYKIWLYIVLICQTIVTHNLFGAVSLLVIFLNSITLAYEDPIHGQQVEFFKYIEAYFIWIYTIEVILKIIAFGFYFGENAFIKNSWNFLDLIIVVTSWLPTGEGSNETLQSMRSLRVLRPLKTVSKSKSLQVILHSLSNSISLLLNAFVILNFFFLIFAIAGV